MYNDNSLGVDILTTYNDVYLKLELRIGNGGILEEKLVEIISMDERIHSRR